MAKRTKKQPEYTNVIVTYDEGGRWTPLAVQGSKDEILNHLKEKCINGKSLLPRHLIPVVAVEFAGKQVWDAITGDFRN